MVLGGIELKGLQCEHNLKIAIKYTANLSNDLPSKNSFCLIHFVVKFNRKEVKLDSVEVWKMIASLL